MPKFQRGKSVWPPPVYVARFRGGETVRMSTWQIAGKPLDFDKCRNGACQVIGNERGRNALGVDETNGKSVYHHGPVVRPRWKVDQVFAPAADIEYGEIEMGGEVFVDPYFAAKITIPVKPKLSATDRLIAQLSKLPVGELARVRSALTQLEF